MAVRFAGAVADTTPGVTVAVLNTGAVADGAPGVLVAVLNAGAITLILTQIWSVAESPTPKLFPSALCSSHKPS